MVLTPFTLILRCKVFRMPLTVPSAVTIHLRGTMYAGTAIGLWCGREVADRTMIAELALEEGCIVADLW